MNETSRQIIVSGAFDNMRSRDVRFLQETARLGLLSVLLWNDAVCRALTGTEPRFPLPERLYYLQALRYVSRVHVVEKLGDADAVPSVLDVQPRTWVVRISEDTPGKRTFCHERGLDYRVVTPEQLAGFPADTPALDAAGRQPTRKKVIVTGCYDWFHTGHIRFFEECSELGDLYVVVGHNANIRLLKGEGHPMFGQDERRYMVGSIRYVTEALISTGTGWMDAAPQVDEIRLDIYAANEDGDKPEKRQFCAEHDVEYVVLKRLPKPGLPRRESTYLRGF
ncbi:MAG: adenylyltransferase/cytidyltransferase family protein [Phycisphaerae bacterium]|nr:adenylyltransferase/cytidyltransferase family protein [Phycisphaerae bacterium]